MRYLLFSLLVVPCVAAQSERPRYTPAVEQAIGPLIDSLVAVIGAAPIDVSIDRLQFSEGRTVPRENNGYGIILTSTARHIVLHEFGHFWSVTNQVDAQRVADSLQIDPFTRRGLERLADYFAENWINRVARQE